MRRALNEETLTGIPWAERGVAPICTLAVLRFVSRSLGILRTQTGTTASSMLLALMGQQEGRIRWLGPTDRKGKKASGGLLTNESRQVTFPDVKGWRERGGRGWVKRGQGVCQLILVHLQNPAGLIRSYCSKGGDGQILFKDLDYRGSVPFPRILFCSCPIRNGNISTVFSLQWWWPKWVSKRKCLWCFGYFAKTKIAWTSMCIYNFLAKNLPYSLCLIWFLWVIEEFPEW